MFICQAAPVSKGNAIEASVSENIQEVVIMASFMAHFLSYIWFSLNAVVVIIEWLSKWVSEQALTCTCVCVSKQVIFNNIWYLYAQVP